MEERRTYAVDKDLLDRTEVQAVCAAVLDVLRPVLGSASVDAVSDYTDTMPSAVREAEAVLKAAGRRQDPRRRDPVMAVRVGTEHEAWLALETYAAWSINVDLLDGSDREVATLHDCGYSITADLTNSEVDVLRQRLDGIPVTLLSEIHQRRRVEKRAERERRWRFWLHRGRGE